MEKKEKTPQVEAWVMEIRNEGAEHGFTCWSRSVIRLLDIVEDLEKVNGVQPFNIWITRAQDGILQGCTCADCAEYANICLDAAKGLTAEELEQEAYKEIEIELANDSVDISGLYDLGGEE